MVNEFQPHKLHKLAYDHCLIAILSSHILELLSYDLVIFDKIFGRTMMEPDFSY